MKKLIFMNFVLICFVLTIPDSYSQNKKYQHEVEFSNSKAERILQINGNGDVNITGYNGKKVIISSNENVFNKEDEKVNEKAKGLKKIGGGGFNIINNEKNNIIIISRPIEGGIDLDIKVPENITLKFGNEVTNRNFGDSLNVAANVLQNVFNGENPVMQDNFISQILSTTLGGVFNGILEGDITIENFSGLVEVSTVDGSVTAKNIDGEIIASTVEGNITVIYKKLNKNRPVYFSTIEGDIDVTLPKNTKADVMARTVEGDVYSGFDDEVVYGNTVNDTSAVVPAHNILTNILKSNYITTKVNGGGQKIHLSTVDGNVYIRKGN